MTTATQPAASAPPREPVFTPALVLFLVVVVGIQAWAAWCRYSLPDLATAVVLLADGDPDGEERNRLLRHLAERGPGEAGLPARWAALLASISLADAGLHRQAQQALGGQPVPERAPAAADREFLALGDAMLANVLAALLAEIDAEPAVARLKWQQVAAQSRMRGNVLAAELAAAAGQRLAPR